MHSIKSNARREARRRGLNPETCVHHDAASDRWFVREPKPAAAPKRPRKPAAPPAPYQPDFRYKNAGDARSAADHQAARIGLKPSDFEIVANGRSATQRFAIVPKGDADRIRREIDAAETSPKAPSPKRRARAKRGKGDDKLSTVLAMITRPEGASMPDLMAATGWLAHTTRARISGLAAKHNLEMTRTRLLGVSIYQGKAKST